MMNSQLGRIVLGSSLAGADEMQASPDADGTYGPLDEVLASLAGADAVEPGEGEASVPGQGLGRLSQPS